MLFDRKNNILQNLKWYKFRNKRYSGDLQKFKDTLLNCKLRKLQKSRKINSSKLSRPTVKEEEEKVKHMLNRSGEV